MDLDNSQVASQDSSFVEVVNDNSAHPNNSNDDWAMVDDFKEFAEGDLKGLTYVSSSQTLTSEHTRDHDRWYIMPSLATFSHSLRVLDLYKNRNLRELHPSVCDLVQLEVLSLKRCESLQSLPANIGNLKRLHTLDLMDASNVSSLPESIGNLTR
jgi:hypothetical protein